MSVNVCFARSLVFFWLLLSICSSPAAWCQTPQDIVTKSEAAYDALASYSCHVGGTITSQHGMVNTASADIKFVRPGQLAASGATMFGDAYGLLINGTNVSVTLNGTTNSSKDPETGVATVTGVSGSTCTTIPALLLHEGWGYPFSPFTFNNDVTIQNVNGNQCYFLVSTGPQHVAYWIDVKTYLLDQCAQRIEFGKLGTYQALQTITNSVINPTIPSTIFTSP